MNSPTAGARRFDSAHVMQPLLEVRHLSKSFGPTRALRDARFQLRSHEIHAIVGENGAGKSTLIKILSGVHAPDEGSILLDGREVSPANPREARELGVSTVFQELSLCENMTVAENIFVNREPTSFGLVRRKELERSAADYLRNFNVHLSPGDLVGDLTLAQRQIVEIVKAISVKARVLILDEPTSSLDDPEAQKLFKLILTLKQNGTGIIFISHKLNEVFQIADMITVFRDGECITTQSRTDTSPDEVIRAMVGREISQVYPPKAKQIGGEKLSMRNFSYRNKFRDVSLTVNEGEVLGLAGLTGAGRSEVMQALFGYRPKDTGEVVYRGKPLNIDAPGTAIREKILYAPEDRKEQGLFLDHSVAMNVAATSLRGCSGMGLMSSTKESELALRMVKDLSIKLGGIHNAVGSLSGGNQQKVVLAKCLAAAPEVLIVDEPTRGIDIGSKIEIYSLLRSFARRGGSVILVSSELPEIIGLSDRVLVFHGGEIVGELTQNITEDAVIDLMFMHSDDKGST